MDKNSWEVQQQNELERISHLEQTPFEKAVLYINLVIILIGAVFLYAYFSINPFTSEEIFHIRSNLNYSIQGHPQHRFDGFVRTHQSLQEGSQIH